MCYTIRNKRFISLLKGKKIVKIGSDNFTIIDDPFMEEGLASKSFDGEGVACKIQKVVDKRCFNNLFA